MKCRKKETYECFLLTKDNVEEYVKFIKEKSLNFFYGIKDLDLFDFIVRVDLDSVYVECDDLGYYHTFFFDRYYILDENDDSINWYTINEFNKIFEIV